jgi:hypothetical protein
MTGSAEIPMQVTEFVWVKRGISFCQNGGEWSAAEPQASGEGEGLYPGSLYVGNKSLILGSGAEGAVDVRRWPGRASGNEPERPLQEQSSLMDYGHFNQLLFYPGPCLLQ